MMKPEIENEHPANYYALAAKLFSDGKRDDAIFWFYLGQLRYRFYLSAAKNIDPAGDPAMFAALSEQIGRPLNEYAFGDIPKLAATIEKVLAWDAANENAFTAKRGNEAALKEIRDGLAEMRAAILARQDEIKAQRTANGLE